MLVKRIPEIEEILDHESSRFKFISLGREGEEDIIDVKEEEALLNGDDGPALQ
jgi:hypothetical protein